MSLLGRPQLAAHVPHLVSEPDDPLEQLRALHVLHDLLAVTDFGQVAERPTKERFQIVFVTARSHRCNDLIDVQVAKMRGRWSLPNRQVGWNAPVEDALESRSRRISRRPARRHDFLQAGTPQGRHADGMR
ncbi:MAG TPA: hypothetical protein VNV18_00325 [Stellaceae bacterium]|nr:hypothetical protein [Stellaceae bacterium]